MSNIFSKGVTVRAVREDPANNPFTSYTIENLSSTQLVMIKSGLEIASVSKDWSIDQRMKMVELYADLDKKPIE